MNVCRKWPDSVFIVQVHSPQTEHQACGCRPDRGYRILGRGRGKPAGVRVGEWYKNFILCARYTIVHSLFNCVYVQICVCTVRALQMASCRLTFVRRQSAFHMPTRPGVRGVRENPSLSVQSKDASPARPTSYTIRQLPSGVTESALHVRSTLRQ